MAFILNIKELIFGLPKSIDPEEVKLEDILKIIEKKQKR